MNWLTTALLAILVILAVDLEDKLTKVQREQMLLISHQVVLTEHIHQLLEVGPEIPESRNQGL